MLNKVFEIEKYNIISDEENYYFFRALNNEDHSDIVNGITTNKENKITKIRTDRERYKDIPTYTENSNLSLEEMFDHVKMHHSKDTNCISLTTNANVALLYGRGNYKDEYVMIKIPKKDLKTEVTNAGVYMMEETEKRINDYKKNITNYIQDKNLSDKIVYYLTAIENSKNQNELDKILERAKQDLQTKEVDERLDIFEKGIKYEYEQTNTIDYPALTTYQNLEKNKIVAMLDIIDQDIINGVNNKFLIQTIGNAFSSLEFIHYKDIEHDKIIETPKEIVDALAILQQEQETPLIKELKQKVLQSIQEKTNKEKFKYDDKNIEEKNDYTIENMFNLTKGKVSYKEATKTYKKAFYLTKSKLRSENVAELLEKITNNDYKYKQIIERIRQETYGIEPEIFSKQNTKKFKVSQSVSLDFDINEQILFSYINSLNKEQLEEIIENPLQTINYYINLTNKDEGYSKEEYYANAIIDNFDWSKLGVVEFSPRRRDIIINKLLEYNIVEIYNNLKNQNIKEKDIANILLTTIIHNNDLNQEINKKETFTLEELEDFLGFYQVKGTRSLKLRNYQVSALQNVDERLETKDFVSVILPTGAGKSFVALAEINQRKDQDVLYLAPSKEILNQIERYIIKHIYTKNLSDEIIKDVEEKELTDDLTIPEKELIKEVFPNLRLETYQKLISQGQKEVIDKKYDLVIMDELHRSGAKEWQRKVEKLIERQLKDQSKTTKFLGITATPQRDDNNKDMSDYWANYFGYTEEEIVKHDHLASNMDLEEGIKLGYVVNPKVVTSKYLSLKQNGILENIKEKVENEKDQNTKNSYERIYQHMRRKVMNAENVEQLLGNNIKKGGKYIVFCPVVTESGEELEDEKGYAEKTNKNKLTGEKALKKHQQDIKEMLKKYYNVNEEEINKMISFNLMLGSQSDSKNNKEKFNFEKNDPSKIKFMTVMNILNEGVHMDNIDGIIWLRPLDKESKILFLQQFGRIIHGVEPNKKLSDEDIPIAIDLVDNIYNVKLEKTQNKTNDIDRMIFIKEWINYHNGKMPDINSEDQTESNYAKILKQIKEEYIKYLDQKTKELLYPQKQIEVKKILKLGQDINLWTYNFQEKITREKSKERAKDHQIGLFSILGEVEDYVKIESLISLSTEDKIAEYIEMLNKGYGPKSNDSETEFSDGSKVNQFWFTHKDKIKEEQETNPKYETGYERAKETLKNYLEKKKKRSSLSVEDRIPEYIEMLNKGYIPKKNDSETEFSDGSKVNHFWNNYKDKIKTELETNPKYETGYEKAKETLKNYLEKKKKRSSLSVEDRIPEYIEMLNKGYIPKKNDSETEFSDGSKVNYFWFNHKDKIKEELETNQKYETGYERAKQAINPLSTEDKVPEYIEMLNKGYVPKSNDPETKFSDGNKVNWFWSTHKDKIKEELETNPKYETGYERAKQAINPLSTEDKVAEYIEMLNKGYVPKYKDSETEFSDGSKVNHFWNNYKDKIKTELETNPKYETGYEKAKEAVKNYLEKSSTKKIKSIKNLVNDNKNNKRTGRY